jgi:colanic acid/amylovoran biosynthesis protein
VLWRSPLYRLGVWFAPVAVRSTLDDFASAAMIVSAGGTYLVPHYRILPKLLDMLVALALRRPLILFTQSLGPFPENRSGLLHFVLRGARAILVRDARSRRHLLDFGIRPDRISECADAAFALAMPSSAQSSIPAPGRTLRVAVSVRDWPHLGADTAAGMERYLDAIADMVRWLIEHHHAEVTFLSTCQGVSEYWTDDSIVAEAVVARLPQALLSRARVNHDFHNPRALIDLLKGFDLVVATRMHVAILALGAAIPVLPIAYEFKTMELFKRLGLGDLVQEIETVNGERLRKVAELILADRRELHATLTKHVERERHSAFRAGDYIRAAVGSI